MGIDRQAPKQVSCHDAVSAYMRGRVPSGSHRRGPNLCLVVIIFDYSCFSVQPAADINQAKTSCSLTPLVSAKRALFASSVTCVCVVQFACRLPMRFRFLFISTGL